MILEYQKQAGLRGRKMALKIRWVFRDVVSQDGGVQNTTFKTPRPCQL